MKMTSAFSPPINRQSLAWLLVVQAFIVAPHVAVVPVWIIAIWGLVAIWRWRIFSGAANYPNGFAKLMLVSVCVVGLLVSFHAHYSFESMVSLLLLGFILKLLEIKTRRDFVLLIFIALFIVASSFIETSQFLMAVYGVFCLLLLMAALLQQYLVTRGSQWLHALRMTGVLLLQAIPIMLLLFVVMPRLGSFWAVPSPTQAKTGMSDSMSPGDFNVLMQSNEVAFRVAFAGEVPAQPQLYWRSLVFSAFDGRRWSPAPEARLTHSVAKPDVSIRYGEHRVSYQIIAEPTGHRWLYNLGAPMSVTGDAYIVADMRVQAVAPLLQRMRYQVTSALKYNTLTLSPAQVQQNIQLPSIGNPESRARASAWMTEAGSTSAYIEKLLAFYRNNFTYTLQPTAVGRDSVDDFLWKTHEGFCEYFASSFVFMMRAAGVPARVVAGYQGGRINPVEGYLIVAQQDAHAWAEVWLDGQGWVLVDPTAAVAPERIQRGLAASLPVQDQQFLGHSFGSSLGIMRFMQDRWDAMNYQWVRWVMNYDADLQSHVLAQWFSGQSLWQLAVWVALAIACFLVVVLGWQWVWMKGKPVSEPLRIYQQLCQQLVSIGIVPQPGETPSALLVRAASVRQDLASPLQQIQYLFEQWVYAGDKAALGELQPLIKALPSAKS